MDPAIMARAAELAAAAPPFTPALADRIRALLHGDAGPALRQATLTTVEKSVTVYRHFDACDHLIYVGISNDWQTRTYAHNRASWWAKWSTRVEVSHQALSRDAALIVEREAIIAARPVFNRVHATEGRDRRIITYLTEHCEWGHLRLRTGVAEGDESRELIAKLVAAAIFDPLTWSRVEL